VTRYPHVSNLTSTNFCDVCITPHSGVLVLKFILPTRQLHRYGFELSTWNFSFADSSAEKGSGQRLSEVIALHPHIQWS